MSMLDAYAARIRDLERENKHLRLQIDHLERTRTVATNLAAERLQGNERLTRALEVSYKIIRAYEDARHDWGNRQNVEAVAKLLWHRFAPAHHIGWEDESRKAEYRLAAADALAVVTGQIELPRVSDEQPKPEPGFTQSQSRGGR